MRPLLVGFISRLVRLLESPGVVLQRLACQTVCNITFKNGALATNTRLPGALA
jgi:hypothetical protein